MRANERWFYRNSADFNSSNPLGTHLSLRSFQTYLCVSYVSRVLFKHESLHRHWTTLAKNFLCLRPLINETKGLLLYLNSLFDLASHWKIALVGEDFLERMLGTRWSHICVCWLHQIASVTEDEFLASPDLTIVFTNRRWNGSVGFYQPCDNLLPVGRPH